MPLVFFHKTTAILSQCIIPDTVYKQKQLPPYKTIV